MIRRMSGTNAGSQTSINNPVLKKKDGTNLKDNIDISYQKWIKSQLEKRILEYSDISCFHMFCGSWNVATRMIEDDNLLSAWLQPPDGQSIDIYAITLQEIIDLNVMNVVINTSSSDENAVMWCRKILKILNSVSNEYDLVIDKHMVGLQLIIACKKSIRMSIDDVRVVSTPTGGMGFTGNKGGIAVRMDVLDSPVCFVGSHFHANREIVEVRNADYQSIVDLSNFAPPTGAVSSSTSSSGIHKMDTRLKALTHQALLKDVSLKILDHEHIFWLGDLNYRIETDIDESEVFHKVQQGEWHALLPKDQLNVERTQLRVFHDFEEGRVTFPPTYKYQPGTDVYECRPDKKLRAPAWCDRILWKSMHKNAVRLLHYTSCLELTMSDHKPVRAIFECDVRTLVAKKLKEVYQELLFAVDKWLNASQPKLTVDNRIIDVKDVKCDIKHKSYMDVTNVGTVMAEWLFVPKNSELLICKNWLKLNPMDGILAPGESSKVEVTIDLNYETALTVLQSNASVLEDIVILRVEKGCDFFCIINATIDLSSIEEKQQLIKQKLENDRLNSKKSVEDSKVMSSNNKVLSEDSDDNEDDDDDDDDDVQPGGKETKLVEIRNSNSVRIESIRPSSVPSKPNKPPSPPPSVAPPPVPSSMDDTSKTTRGSIVMGFDDIYEVKGHDSIV